MTWPPATLLARTFDLKVFPKWRKRFKNWLVLELQFDCATNLCAIVRNGLIRLNRYMNHLDLNVHPISVSDVGEGQVTSSVSEANESQIQASRKADPWRKWLWVFLGAVLVGQLYYVREMLAALVLFAILFAICGTVAGVIYLLGRAGESTISAAEPLARKSFAYAEEISRKAFRRPHSAPAP
jgi:hypothetical protein